VNAGQLAEVERHFPERMAEARAMAARVEKQTGRPTFWGRPTDYEGGPCAVDAFE